MTHRAIVLAFCFAALGCVGTPTCPMGYALSAEGRCLCAPGTVSDAMGHCVPADAGVDAAVDAAMIGDAGAGDTGADAGPMCTTETCNGTDDDCDGLIDEGVITVGPAVTVTGADLFGGLIIPHGTGFGVASMPNTMPSSPAWFDVDAHGLALGATGVSGADVAFDAPWTPAVTSDERQILLSGVNNAAHTRLLFGFDPTTGTRRTGTTPFVLPLPAGRNTSSEAVFTSAGGGRATLFVAHLDTAASAPNAIRRFRLDVSGDPPRVLSASDVAVDVLNVGGGWSALSTDEADYVVYRRSATEVVLIAGPTGDATGAFHTVGTIATGDTAQMHYATIAIRDRSAPVSASNPLGIAWLGRISIDPHGAATFAQVTNTTILASTPPVSFPDSRGAFGGFFTIDTIALLALDDPGHWILANQDSDAAITGAQLQIREIIAGGATVRRLDVPDEFTTSRTNIGLARSGASIRVVERANTVGLVTRSIGCE